MTGMSTYGSNLLVNTLVGLETIPSTLYVAVTTSVPSQFGTGSDLNEPGGNYARQVIAMDDTFWSNIGNGAVTSIASVEFPTASVDWGIINCWVLCTALTAGEVIVWQPFKTPNEIQASNKLTIGAGSLSIKLVNG